MFAVRVVADCMRFPVLLWGAYLLDDLPVTLTFSLVCIPPSMPACGRTTYCPIEACTFDAFPFPSCRVAGSRTFLTNAATMCGLPLDPRSRCSSAEYTTCHYTQTWSNIHYRAPLQYLCSAQPNTECTNPGGLRLSLVVSGYFGVKDSSILMKELFSFPTGKKLVPISVGVTFSKAQSSKLERLFCHVSVTRDIRALSFELWNSIQKCQLFIYESW